MSPSATFRAPSSAERMVVRQVFETWSIEVPVALEETFVEEDAYWHAFDDERSVSLTSMLIEGEDGPVRAESIMAVFPAMEGEPVDALPPSVLGSGALVEAIQPARASRCLSGFLCVDGRVLLATITSDDEDWARQIWLSIRHHPGLPRRRIRR